MLADVSIALVGEDKMGKRITVVERLMKKKVGFLKHLRDFNQVIASSLGEFGMLFQKPHDVARRTRHTQAQSCNPR